MACARSNEMIEESRAYEQRLAEEARQRQELQLVRRYRWLNLSALIVLMSFTSRLIYLFSRLV